MPGNLEHRRRSVFFDRIVYVFFVYSSPVLLLIGASTTLFYSLTAVHSTSFIPHKFNILRFSVGLSCLPWLFPLPTYPCRLFSESTVAMILAAGRSETSGLWLIGGIPNRIKLHQEEIVGQTSCTKKVFSWTMCYTTICTVINGRRRGTREESRK